MYDRRKKERIRRIREEEERFSLDYRRKSDKLEKSLKEQKEKVREEEIAFQ